VLSLKKLEEIVQMLCLLGGVLGEKAVSRDVGQDLRQVIADD